MQSGSNWWTSRGLGRPWIGRPSVLLFIASSFGCTLLASLDGFDRVADAGQAEQQCTLLTNDEPCDTCIISKCTNECLNCENDPGCSAIWECVNACDEGATEAICPSACKVLGSLPAINKFDEYLGGLGETGCVGLNCSAKCAALPE